VERHSRLADSQPSRNCGSPQMVMAWQRRPRDPVALTRWRERLVRLAGYGSEGYPPAIRPPLKIMNVTAYLIAGFTLIYTLQQVFLDFATWKPVIIINLVLIAVALCIPFLHRFSDIAGALVISCSEGFGLLALTYYLGRDAGLHMQYFAAIAAFFVIIGLERLKLIAVLVVLALFLHLAAWASFPRHRAVLSVAQGELDTLYVTAVITTFSIIAVVVYYAFRLAELAQAQTDLLLHNMLPDSIVDRLKERPEATIADEFAEGSVLFADLKGFVAIAKRLGPGPT